MNNWVKLGLVLTFLFIIGIGAAYVGSLPTGQVIATLASLTVATVGLWAFFRKSHWDKA